LITFGSRIKAIELTNDAESIVQDQTDDDDGKSVRPIPLDAGSLIGA